MIRGTTPTHYFKNIPIDVAEIKKVKVVYSQEGEKLVEKRTEDCKLYDRTIETTLTQGETFKFICGKRANVQVRIITKSGASLVSFLKYIPVFKCNDDEVIE